MFRHAKKNIKWMLTISLLFHLTFLSIIFSSGIFKRSDLFTARHSPFSSIQVSIVNLPDDNRSVMSAPVSAKSTIEKNNSKQLTKIEKLKEHRSVPPANAVISAPVKKEHEEVKQDETASGGGQSAESRSEDSSGRGSGAAAHQEARLIAGDSMVSGPVVDMPSFKYDYYLGLIKSGTSLLLTIRPERH